MKKRMIILQVGVALILCACTRIGKVELPTVTQPEQTTSAREEVSTPAETESVTQTQAPIELPSATNIDIARENLQKTIDTYIPGIVCWGDSLTVGAGSETGYPDVVRELINTEILAGTGCEIPVINMGIGGESSATITARACGMPMITVADFTIPAECVNVPLNFRNSEGQIVEPVLYGDTGVEYVEICGVKGTFEFLPDVTGVSGGNYLYYFKRSEPGEAVMVPAGTEILTRGYQEYKDYLPIIFMGENGGFADSAQLIRQQLSIVETGKNTERYLIIGLTSGTAADRAQLEADMLQQYGDKYLNARAIMSAQGAAIAEIETTIFDQWMTDEGKVPGRLLSDSVHLNEAGYRALGIVVYNRLKELGYFDEVMEAAQTLRNLK